MVEWQAISSQIVTIMVFVVGGLMMLAIVGVSMYVYMQAKRYKYRVIVFKRFTNPDGQEMLTVVSTSERGAIIKDKKLKKWSFHLRKANIDLGEEELENYDEDRELDIPSVPFASGGEVVFVEQLAQRKYAVGSPFILEGDVKILVTQADLAEAMRSFDINARTFGKKDSNLLGFALYLAFAVMVLILIVVILNKFEALQQFGDQWLEGAKMLRSNSVPSTAPG